jgi:hypothetical protein
MSLLIWCIGTLLGLTWRIKILDPHAMRPLRNLPIGRIYCFWHAHLLAIAFIFRNSGVTALVSKSNDGRIAAKVAQQWKHDIIYGSSSSGATASLRACIRHLQQGKYLGITPDGPRGPREHVKAGVAQMSLLSTAPVVIMSMLADRFWRLNSWDKCIIPKPFAKVTVIIGKPITFLPAEASVDPTETFRRQIEESMPRYEEITRRGNASSRGNDSSSRGNDS